MKDLPVNNSWKGGLWLDMIFNWGRHLAMSWGHFWLSRLEGQGGTTGL